MTTRHSKLLVALFILTGAGMLISLSLGSLVGVACSVGTGIVLAFVMSIAWTRFRGQPAEHHAPSDKLLDDTAP